MKVYLPLQKETEPRNNQEFSRLHVKGDMIMKILGHLFVRHELPSHNADFVFDVVCTACLIVDSDILNCLVRIIINLLSHGG